MVHPSSARLTRGPARAAGIAPVLAWALTCSAQLIPDPETGPTLVTSRLVNNQLELRDAQTNAPIVVTRGIELTTPLDPSVRVDVRLQKQPAGADIIVTYFNSGDAAASIGMLRLGVITLGPDISYLDTKYMQDFVPANVATFVGQAWGYPDYAYSPVWVLTSPTYALGVSVQYPVLEFEHDVTVWMDNPRGEYLTGEGGRGWSLNFGLSDTGNEPQQRVHRPASLPAHTGRTYVMSVRVCKNPAEWVRTLTPYRAFFRGTYGGVTYERRTTPIMSMGVSDKSLCSETNPHGWATEFRPDLNGWSKLVTYVKQYLPGWPSIMLWTPSGYYMNHKSGNYPPQICTPWLETPALSTAFDPANGLPALAKGGRELGIWWGRSCQVSPGGWDPPYLENFDPDRADHFNGKVRELDLAVKAGVRVIGLDTFDSTYTPMWKLYRWMCFMRLRHPDVHFAMEPRPCDVLHTLAPCVLNGWNDRTPPVTSEDLYAIKHPLWLADFLLPGHETWAVYRYTEWLQYYNIGPTPSRVIADMNRHAAMGFTPVMQAPGNIPPTTVTVAESWMQTVPADLRLDPTPQPFGPVRAGSKSVALGTSFRAQPGGGVSWPDVRGYRPQKPGPVPPTATPAAAPADAAPAATGPAGSGDLSRKVVVRRTPGRAKATRPESEPREQEQADASDVRTFYGEGRDSPAAPRR